MKYYWDDEFKNQRELAKKLNETMDHMMGRTLSFRKSIVDKKGNFSHEMLTKVLDEMFSYWEKKLTDTSSEAQEYIDERKEMYRSYLYLMMRCCVENGACKLLMGSSYDDEQPDFAFLLAQARYFIDNWCVTNTNINVPYRAYKEYFGFHIYPLFAGDAAIDEYWDCLSGHRPLYDHIEDMTNLGLFKHMYLAESREVLFSLKKKKAAVAENAEEAEEAENAEEAEEVEEAEEAENAEEAEEVEEAEEAEEDTAAEVEDDYDYDESDDGSYNFYEDYYMDIPEEVRTALWEAAAEEGQREEDIRCLSIFFTSAEEYKNACESFCKCFEAADPMVLMSFYDDIEEIIDLYLIKTGAATLTDTSKMLNIVWRINDSPLLTAKQYSNSIRLKRL